MSSANSWFDVLIVLCGVYVIFTTVKMKNGGEINASVILGKNITEGMIRDRDGFVKYMYPRAMALGIITVVFGIIDFFFGTSKIVGFSIIVAFLIILAIYCHQISIARKRFVD